MYSRSRYFFTVGIVLFLLAASQVYVQYALQSSLVDARTLNRAGRQRMLVQKLSYYLVGPNRDKEEARNIYDRYWESHLLLTQDSNRRVNNISSASFNLLKELEPNSLIISEIIGKVGGLTDSEEVLAVETLRELLQLNNEVVSQIEQEHRQQMFTVSMVELIFSVIMVFVVAYEIFVVFLPTFSRLRQSRDSLLKTSLKLEESIKLSGVLSQKLKSSFEKIIFSAESMSAMEVDENLSRDLISISKSAQGMRDIVDVVLRRGQVSSGSSSIEYFQLSEIIEEVKRDLWHLIMDSDAVISVDCNVRIKGNRTEIKLIFQNLISNSIKYRRDDVTPEISLSCSSSTSDLFVTVKDNGLGIADQDLERIFDYGFRAQETIALEGHGYGLYHCLHIARSHGGQLNVESQVNRGTKFFLILPI